jgi:hypothetical protein
MQKGGLEKSVFVEWRKIKGRYYAYARVAEWNRDLQRSLDEQFYLGKNLEKAIQKLEELATRFPRYKINTTVLTKKLLEKFPGHVDQSEEPL